MKFSDYPVASTFDNTDYVLGLISGEVQQVPKTLLPAGGGGGASNLLPFDVPPAVPSAWDDEFTSNTLDPKWTSPANSGSTIVQVLQQDMIILKANISSGTGNGGFYGIRQNAPVAQSFTVSIKMDHSSMVTSSNIVGLFVARVGGPMWVYGPYTDNSDAAYAFNYSGYSETGAVGNYVSGVNNELKYTAVANSSRNGRWLRMVYNYAASTIAFYWSMDGINWTLQTTATSIGNIDRIGIALFRGVQFNHLLLVDWFRVTTP